VVTSKADQRWAELIARNLTLPGIEATTLHLQARELPPQRPCDFGLFGDDAAQIDLEDVIARMR
jgi:hypothetical protein